MQAEQIQHSNFSFGDRDFVEKPWGGYYVLGISDGAKVKRLIINPNSRTSLQTHKHRSEHWVVARGKASVLIGDNIDEIYEGGAVFVPAGTRHRVENNSTDSLEIIEVQTGNILSEADVTRLEDDYGRASKYSDLT